MKKASIAFFDVDETLICIKSMFDFLDYFEAKTGAIDAKGVTKSIDQLKKAGKTRAETNRAFWSHFEGLSVDQIVEAAQRWTQEKLSNPKEFFIQAGYEGFAYHRRQGDRIILLSGSGYDILKPLAEELAVDWLCATELVSRNGFYTGEVMPPVMIGPAKLEAARIIASQFGTALSDCHAYGDHVSDLPVLEAVGHPTIIGEQGSLASIGRQRGWPILPNISCAKAVEFSPTGSNHIPNET